MGFRTKGYGENITLPLNPTNTIHTPGRIRFNPTDHTMDLDTDLDGVSIQLGQETLTIVYNDTGVQINNGSIIYPTGEIFLSRAKVDLASATTHETCPQELFVATMDIPDGEFGYAVELSGRVRGLDTSLLSLGDVYLSTIPGAFTQTKPLSPNYSRKVGSVTVIDAVNGEIQARITGSPIDTTINFWNGIFRETISFTITSNGSTIIGSLERKNGGDLTAIFSDGLYLLDTTPPLEINLVAGTDTNPQIQYVYFLQSSKTLEVATGDWPVTEHIKISTVVLKSAPTTQSEGGAFRNQNWNDHIESIDNNIGHLQHIGERIRQHHAIHHAGTEGSCTIVEGSPDNVYISVTSGIVFQLHRQTFPAFNMQTGDDIHIVNDFTTPYKTVTNLNNEVLDANGNTLSNKAFSFVVWGICNSGGELSHLMLNKPSNGYSIGSPNDAINDALNYSVYDIPTIFKGTGFLIARFTFTLGGGGLQWTLIDTQDLRGYVPNNIAGGGTGGSGITTYLGLTDTPVTYTALAFQRANASGTALENVLANGVNLSEFNNNLTQDNIPNGTTYVQTENNYTDVEKSKLAGLESSKFLGQYASLGALETAYPSPPIGSYGYVDGGIGSDVTTYIWDNDDSKYVAQLGESNAETSASIKTKYESNPDTNAFTDIEKTKVGNLSGTNTGDVSLVGEPDYLTIVGQVLTRNLINLVNHITGTLGIGNGGTGQTTALAGFNALSPLTTQGDIIYHNGSDNIRLAKGTAGQVLTMNSGATAPEWADAGGGASLLDLVGYQEGGWSASGSGAVVSGWGLCGLLSVIHSSSGAGVDSDGAYLEQIPTGSANYDMYISSGNGSAYICESLSYPVFMVKFGRSLNTSFGLDVGLNDATSYSTVFNFIGITDNGSGGLQFETADDGGETTTATGVTWTTQTLILVCEVVSNTEVNFWLYDSDYTELATATHTTNIPDINEPAFLKSLYRDKAGNSSNTFKQYAAKIILKK